jgi:hypothetical protein
MNNLILFPTVKAVNNCHSEYSPKTNVKEIEIVIRDEEVDNVIYHSYQECLITRAEEIEKLKDAARTKESKKDTLMELHLEMMRTDPVYRNKVLTEVHQMICLNAFSIRKS